MSCPLAIIRRTLATAVVVAAVFGTSIAAFSAEPDGSPRIRDTPLSPTEELATFRLADRRLTIELVAAEPQLDSPVAICWDADGRMYVAEMIDYPLGPTAGQIRLLEDRDGDGRYEHATVFADGLHFPNGVLAARGGLFVTAAPDLLFLNDTDGDGVADEKHGRVHRLWRRQSATAGQRADLGPRQLDLRRQRPQRRRDSPPDAIRPRRPCRFAAATFASRPTAAASRPPAGKASSASRATTGATASCRGTRFRSGTRCSSRRFSIAIRGWRRSACATLPIRSTPGRCFPSAPARKRSIASGPTTTTPCAG